ncbi:protein of unknown function (plasmid) [Cupriavidus neocaledonicus]|uniref:Uncharacterized protein n=1 Tax=Cupriavidus neocaledonicus TaxID=1040979 RepID=A0A375HM47_9BURK|nr:hypothetical protein CBM2605_B130311 [Cupriavidus neocaledonicus]SPD59318.1 protein of unknown function [Cupriavidus neocaledonicus]
MPACILLRLSQCTPGTAFREL